MRFVPSIIFCLPRDFVTQELNFNSSHASAAAAAALPRRCCSIMAKRQRAGTDDELAK